MVSLPRSEKIITSSSVVRYTKAEKAVLKRFDSAKLVSIENTSDDTYNILSSDKTAIYQVRTKPYHYCDCLFFFLQGKVCKHLMACLIAEDPTWNPLSLFNQGIDLPDANCLLEQLKSIQVSTNPESVQFSSEDDAHIDKDIDNCSPAIPSDQVLPTRRKRGRAKKTHKLSIHAVKTVSGDEDSKESSSTETEEVEVGLINSDEEIDTNEEIEDETAEEYEDLDDSAKGLLNKDYPGIENDKPTEKRTSAAYVHYDL